jgi:hypothetical protein
MPIWVKQKDETGEKIFLNQPTLSIAASKSQAANWMSMVRYYFSA